MEGNEDGLSPYGKLGMKEIGKEGPSLGLPYSHSTVNCPLYVKPKSELNLGGH